MYQTDRKRLSRHTAPPGTSLPLIMADGYVNASAAQSCKLDAVTGNILWAATVQCPDLPISPIYNAYIYTPMNGKFLPRKTFQKGLINTGVFGTGIGSEAQFTHMITRVKYSARIECANRTAVFFCNQLHSDGNGCLFHIGDKYLFKKQVCGFSKKFRMLLTQQPL